MQYYMSEEEAQYMDAHHGQFSKKLAEFAISNMRVRVPGSSALKPSQPHPFEEMMTALESNGLRIEEKEVYTAWYLYNMTFADYVKSLDSDSRRAHFVDETLHDPDSDSCAVLACYRAKMDVRGEPIHWERFI